MAQLRIVGVLLLLCLTLCLVVNDALAVRCNRFPKNVSKKSKQSGDGGYRVLIDGNPTGYRPGKIYNGKPNCVPSLS